MECGSRFWQQHAPERSPERKYAERIAAMLSPAGKNADLDRFIEDVVLDGEPDFQKREANLRASGFDPRDLVGYGREVVNRIAEIERIGPHDPAEEQKLKRLEGLRDSVLAKDGTASEQELFQLGLRLEVTRLLRKWIRATASLNPSEQEEVLFNKPDTELDRFTVEAYLAEKQRSPERLAGREERLLALADDEMVAKKLAFIRELAGKLATFEGKDRVSESS